MNRWASSYCCLGFSVIENNYVRSTNKNTFDALEFYITLTLFQNEVSFVRDLVNKKAPHTQQHKQLKSQLIFDSLV